MDSADDGGSSGTDTIEFIGTGDVVYIIVDGYSNSSNLSGAYTLFIDECVVSCVDKGCNEDNGCGTACGCTVGFCDPSSGQCVDQLPGNLCASANEITQFGVALPGSTTTATNDYSFDSCGGTSGKGGASNDQVWTFQGLPGATYTITLDPTGWDPVLYAIAAPDCSDIDGTCLDAADNGASNGLESITITVPSDGSTIYVFVDGYSDDWNLSGSYTLTVSEPCLPTCAGQSCNSSNGCGGQCGCPTGLVCNGGNGECVDPSQGDTCATAFEVTAFNQPLSGNTNASQPDYSFDSCPGTFSGKGDASNDQVWFLETDPGATYTITLEPQGWDPVLYAIVANDCSNIDSACLDSSESGGSGGSESITVTAPLDGGPMYIFVDGYSTSTNLSGSYTLTVGEPCLPECSGLPCSANNGCGGICGCTSGEVCEPVSGDCIDALSGSTCESAFELEEFGSPVGGNTSFATGDYSATTACDGISSSKGQGGNDHVWTFESTPGATYTAKLNPDGWDPVLYVAVGEDCSNISASCLGAKDSGATGGVETVTFTAPPEGGPIWLFVDGYSNTTNYAGLYTLTVTEPCTPSCDGLDCGSDGCGGSCGTCASGVCQQGVCAGPPPSECAPVDVVSCGQTIVGLSQNNNSSDAFSSYSCQSFSSDNYGNSYEVTYVFEADFSGSFTVSGIDDGSMDVTVLKEDGNGCVDNGANCIGQASSDLTVSVVEGDIFYIVWDSYSFTPVGSFSMAVECCI
ncbi:MAG: hypothetical protein VX223_06050, partial [Myxococcota bacterium]|nr:hypothetical protein [Myxococcota bacterium]